MAAPARVRTQVRSVPSSAWSTGDSPPIMMSREYLEGKCLLLSLNHPAVLSLSHSVAESIVNIAVSQITVLGRSKHRNVPSLLLSWECYHMWCQLMCYKFALHQCISSVRIVSKSVILNNWTIRCVWLSAAGATLLFTESFNSPAAGVILFNNRFLAATRIG